MIIRHATANDIQEMARIEAASYPAAEGASEESIRRRVEVFPNHFWLLENDGEILSFINGLVTDRPDLTDDMYDDPAIHKEDGFWQMIFSVVTAPEHRHKGYASCVMRQVIKDCRSGSIAEEISVERSSNENYGSGCRDIESNAGCDRIAEEHQRGCRGIVLTCKEKLIPFYEQFGFKNEGVSVSTHGDTIWYQMRLTY